MILQLLLPLCMISFISAHPRYSFLRNYNTPICSNCKFYKPAYTYSDYEQRSGYCKRFGEVNIMDGQITYESIHECRKDERKCGLSGKLYEDDEWKTVKVIAHDMNRYNYIVLMAATIVFVFIVRLTY